MPAAPTSPPDGAGGIFAGSLFMLESAVVDQGYGGDKADAADLIGAAELLSDTVRVAEQNLDRPHPLAVALRGHLAECLAGLGRVGPARDAFERAAADAERLWGPRAPETVRLRDELLTPARAARPVP